MKARVILGLAVACMVLIASSLAEAGRDYAMSPVGAWAVYMEPAPGSPGDAGTGLAEYHRSGTMTGAAMADPWTNTVGSWEKVRANRYRSTFYVLIPDGPGVLKISEEFWMLNRNRMEGRYEIWWVPGEDPLGDAVVPLFWGSYVFKRIHAEPLQLP